AGFTIQVIGMTEVFVPTDLTYMGMTHARLDSINPRLIPLIAHDRAGFGGWRRDRGPLAVWLRLVRCAFALAVARNADRRHCRLGCRHRDSPRHWLQRRRPSGAGSGGRRTLFHRAGAHATFNDG